MKHKNTYLYLESFVVVNSYGDDVLLYNIITKQYLEIIGSQKISEIINNLISDKNMYFVHLTESEKSDTEVSGFIMKLKSMYMGDLVDLEREIISPVQIKPFPKLFSEPSNDEFKNLKGKRDILKYLKVLSIYINSKMTDNGKKSNILSHQYLANRCEKEENILEIEMIIKLLDECIHSSLEEVNILGGNILKYKSLNQLLDYISKEEIFINLHFLYDQIINDDKLFRSKNFSKTNTSIVVHIYDIEKKLFEKLFNIISLNKLNYELNFYVSNLQEVKIIEDYLDNNSLVDTIHNIKPLLDNNNYKFWQKEIFWTKQEIFNSEVSKNQIFSNYKLNSIEFGKLIIRNNGEVFANINNDKIGNISNDDIKTCILNEFTFGESWFKLRKDVQPCDKCIYNLFCPPISNVEYFLKRNNLCDIINNN